MGQDTKKWGTRMTYDSIIIGGGPAAVSAALTLRNRNRTAAVITGGVDDIPLSRSHRITNYPGMPDISGRDLLLRMERQAAEAGAEIIRGRAISVLDMGGSFGVAVGPDYVEGKTVILCTGVRPAKLFPGEKELLGRGVSYCVTCDGMLYRGKDVCLVGFTSDTEAEAGLLRDMGCRVETFTKKNAGYAVMGDTKVTGLKVGENTFPCEAVFILRSASAPDTLLEGLEMDGGHIRVGAGLSTSVPGVFAAGDCIGPPYQVAKAVGDGNVAALSAAGYLEEQHPRDP